MYWRVTGPFRRSLNRMVADVSLTELGDGVYAWLLPGGETGVANAGVVVEPDGITVIDTLMVRSQWEPFAAAVAALELPVRRTILTHAHIDHVGGTKAFPNAAIYIRGYDRRSVMKLSDTPAEYVVREVLESALRMARMALEKLGLSEEAIERAETLYRSTDKERLSKQIAAGDLRAARNIILTEPQARDPAGQEPG